MQDKRFHVNYLHYPQLLPGESGTGSESPAGVVGAVVGVLAIIAVVVGVLCIIIILLLRLVGV